MKQMELIIKILLEGIRMRLEMMMSNLIWHILIKCPELEITVKYTHDAILLAGNAQMYYHRETGIFLYFPKQMSWVSKLFVQIYDLRILKFPPPYMSGNCVTGEWWPLWFLFRRKLANG